MTVKMVMFSRTAYVYAVREEVQNPAVMLSSVINNHIRVTIFQTSQPLNYKESSN